MQCFVENDCSQSELLSLIGRLPTKSRYVYQQKFTHYLPSFYYDIKLTCYFNYSIQITYRCNLPNKRWIYVNGFINRFRQCYPPCNNSERNKLLNKYFTRYQQTKIRTKYIRRIELLRLSCFNKNENRWKAILYKCGTITITKHQWFRLHSCFQSTIAGPLPGKSLELV